MKKGKKIFKIVLCVMLVLAVVIGGTLGYLLTGIKPAEMTERQIDTADGILRVGVVSDLQLTAEGTIPENDERYRKSLEVFKENGVNMIINAGDFTDVGTKAAYENHKRIFDSVYSEAERANLEICNILGNHDYWLPMFVDCWEIPFTRKMHSRLCEYTYVESPWTHKVVNGFHFIALSPTSGGMGGDGYSDKILKWADEQIQIAVKDNPNLPVFVITHNNPENTVYMSEDNTCSNLTELFSKYPQVVSLSGHSHAPLMDEMAIYQKDFTAISTQCTSYVCTNEGANFVYHDDLSFIEDNPMIMIMELDSEKITIHRYSNDGTEQKDPWVINFPVSKDTFTYTDSRKDASPAPVWQENFEIATEATDNDDCRLTFTAAQHDDMVRQYRAVFEKDGKTVELNLGDESFDHLIFITDFALPKDKRSEKVIMNLPKDKYESSLPEGTYTLTLYAQDAFYNESEPQTAQIEIKY